MVATSQNKEKFEDYAKSWRGCRKTAKQKGRAKAEKRFSSSLKRTK